MMRDFVKSIRLTVPQVLIILTNAMVLTGWGIKIDHTVGTLTDDVVEIRADVVSMREDVDDLNIRSAVLEERTGVVPSPNGGGN